MNNKVRDCAVIAIFAALLFVLQMALSFLPNIQLTVLLLFIYSRVLGINKTLIIILIHVFLINLVWGSLNLIYTPSMFIGYAIIPIGLNTVFKKVNNIYVLSLLGFLFSLTYCWCFILPSILLTDISFIAYIIGDIYFELIMGVSSFISILWLYERLLKIFNKIYLKEE